jgi:hypothetical protein
MFDGSVDIDVGWGHTLKGDVTEESIGLMYYKWGKDRL